jgi:hypothetical protein
LGTDEKVSKSLDDIELKGICVPTLLLLDFSHLVPYFFSLFKLEPRTKTVFGFPEEFNIATCVGLKRHGLLIHARLMIDMFHGVVQLLGPQQEEITELLAKV